MLAFCGDSVCSLLPASLRRSRRASRQGAGSGGLSASASGRAVPEPISQVILCEMCIQPYRPLRIPRSREPKGTRLGHRVRPPRVIMAQAPLSSPLLAHPRVHVLRREYLRHALLRHVLHVAHEQSAVAEAGLLLGHNLQIHNRPASWRWLFDFVRYENNEFTRGYTFACFP